MKFLSLLCFVGLIASPSLADNDVLPAVPLVVKNPYLSTWMSARQLAGDWPTFWTGAIKGMAGLVKVNGQTYEFMGHPTQDPIGTNQRAQQTGLKVTPTQSIFTFHAGPVELTVNFFTPIDPTDLKLLSLPASYIAVSVRSLDNNNHQVQIYIDLSAEWTSGDSGQGAQWDVHTVGANVVNLNMKLRNPKVLEENSDAAQWGTIKFFTDSHGVTYEANECSKMRSAFVKDGRLNNQIDGGFRNINDRWPGVAFAREITAGKDRSANVYFAIAHVRRPAISYTVGQFNQLWESYFGGDDNKMIDFVFGDRESALKRAEALDNKVLGDARKAGGDSYARVVSAALRQAYGGIELVGTPDKPWLMLKEISSDGNCQTVDVIYPHYPVQLYLNPTLLKYLLEPLLDNQERNFFPHKYSMHDLGSSYPRCVGHRDGKEEGMEVEESANMVIMMASYVKATNDKDFATKHYNIAKQWTQYLVDHGLITGDALTTDDFLGRIKNSTNLSAKAIVGIGGMAQLAEHAGHHDDQQHYRQIAEKYVQEWIRMGEDPSGKHMKLSYNSDNTWFMIYNLYPDVYLDTKLIPEKIYKQQDEWYIEQAKKYGVPLKSGDNQTKYDWMAFTAASSSNQKLRQLIYDRTALFLRETTKHVPFSDRGDTATGGSPGFINRPVIGGIFAPLTVKH